MSYFFRNFVPLLCACAYIRAHVCTHNSRKISVYAPVCVRLRTLGVMCRFVRGIRVKFKYNDIL